MYLNLKFIIMINFYTIMEGNLFLREHYKKYNKEVTKSCFGKIK